MQTHKYYMRRCIELALSAEGFTSPNPMVGCVIVHEGRIIGEGFHHRAGQPHAEVNAVASVENPELLADSTLYVNLEPCSHQGKTPPCTDLIISKKIPRVVVGMIDPFAEVSGNGVRKLREAGVEVETGLLEAECRRLNRRFVTYHTKKRPYITLKWAQTVDGYIDNNRPALVPTTWMTGPTAKTLVHRLRAQSDAILVGTNTVERDNPMLTARESGGRNPLRVVLDRTLRLSSEARVFDGTTPTLLLTAEEKREQAKVRYPRVDAAGIDFNRGWTAVLDELHARKILSLFVEGGAEVLRSLIEAGLWDEAYVFVSPMRVADLTGGTPGDLPGIKACPLSGSLKEVETLGDTKLYIYEPGG